MKVSFQEFLASMPQASKSIEEYSVGHCARMASLAKILCDKLMEMYPEMLTDEDVARIMLFAPIHDVGKIEIPRAILKKETKLSQDEFEIVKKHTILGAEILKSSVAFDSEDDMLTAVQIAMLHHEKYDGSGYPYGLKGGEIPLCARIVALVDVYDAIRSDRPYKRALSRETAEQIMLEGDGRTRPQDFDPILLKTFAKCLDAFDALYC